MDNRFLFLLAKTTSTEVIRHMSQANMSCVIKLSKNTNHRDENATLEFEQNILTPILNLRQDLCVVHPVFKTAYIESVKELSIMGPQVPKAILDIENYFENLIFCQA